MDGDVVRLENALQDVNSQFFGTRESSGRILALTVTKSQALANFVSELLRSFCKYHGKKKRKNTRPSGIKQATLHNAHSHNHVQTYRHAHMGKKVCQVHAY